jgi:hypothetical protein
MSWWKRLWHGGTVPSSPERLHAVRLTMREWSEEASSGKSRVWRDPEGDVLSLSLLDASLGLPEISDESALQQWARRLAESRRAGLIEVRVITGTLGAAVGLIYKRLQMPAYIFTGMLLVPRQEVSQVWTVAAKEHGTTGVREALVTSELLTAGQLTIEGYEQSWALDPYDPKYRGVDRSVLRFISDDERYDGLFPEHPLSKVRRVLAMLPHSVRAESQTPIERT